MGCLSFQKLKFTENKENRFYCDAFQTWATFSKIHQNCYAESCFSELSTQYLNLWKKWHTSHQMISLYSVNKVVEKIGFSKWIVSQFFRTDSKQNKDWAKINEDWAIYWSGRKDNLIRADKYGQQSKCGHCTNYGTFVVIAVLSATPRTKAMIYYNIFVDLFGSVHFI